MAAGAVEGKRGNGVRAYARAHTRTRTCTRTRTRTRTHTCTHTHTPLLLQLLQALKEVLNVLRLLVGGVKHLSIPHTAKEISQQNLHM